MKISIIIPTHNRAESLRRAMDSVVALKSEADFEFVIVDNNSTDTTPEVVKSYEGLARYVFEGRTSFTAARRAGSDAASGDILLYLDDDVIVRPGSLTNIIDIFTRHPDCGVIAGHIDAQYEMAPPAWTLVCQNSFNGWSLFNRETYDFLTSELQEAPAAAGPMMAIRKTNYDKVGGFPPDTVGVETNRGSKSFNKLYIGPGDFGLSMKIRALGQKVYYSRHVLVYHVIPPIRFTVAFWRSRMIGEGYMVATSQRGFFHLGTARAAVTRLWAQLRFLYFERRLVARLSAGEAPSEGMLPEELWVLYYRAYLDMDHVLRRYPDLWKLLWRMANQGVDNASYDSVVAQIPAEYKALVASDVAYDPRPLKSVPDYEAIVAGRGFARSDIGAMGSGLGRGFANLVCSMFEAAKLGRSRMRQLSRGG